MSEKIPEIKKQFEDVKTENQNRELKFEEIEELETPIKRIIRQLRERIDSGDYGLIIGDDASGRIPAIIVGNFIQKISEIKNLRKPEIIFVPGKLDKESAEKFLEKRGGLDEYISHFGGTKEKRVLIVTDTLVTGASLSSLVQLLKENNYTADIATIGIMKDYAYPVEETLKGTEIISGAYTKWGSHTPEIYKRHDLSGVFKHRGDIKSKSYTSPVEEITNTKGNMWDEDEVAERKEEIQFKIRTSRGDASKMVEKLVKWYQGSKDE